MQNNIYFKASKQSHCHFAIVTNISRDLDMQFTLENSMWQLTFVTFKINKNFARVEL